MLTAWILWLGTLGCSSCKATACCWPARSTHPWLAGLAISAPVLAAFALAPWIPRVHPELYEKSFLFFARNLGPLLIGLGALIPVVQIFSERRFRELEIL